MQNIELTSIKLRKLFFIVFITCFIAIFISSFDTILAKSRDVKRKADIKVITKALDLYYDKYGFYPESVDDWRGWDLTYDYKNSGGSFLKVLKEEGFINKEVNDPINNSTHYYRYKKYFAESLGCKKPFYILQIINFELFTDKNGKGICSELNWADMAPNGYTIQVFE